MVYSCSCDVCRPVDAGTARVLDLLRAGAKGELCRAILPIFSQTKEVEAHGYAIRVLHVIFRGLMMTSIRREDANEQFFSVASFYATGQRFTKPVREALFSLMVNPHLPTRDLDKPTTIAFFMSVLHHELWRVIFAVAHESDMDTRRVALEDVTTLLHENMKNARSIVKTRGWQNWIYLLLTDVPRNDQTKTHKQVYGFLLNALTLIHHSYFHESAEFVDLLADSLQSLHLFAGLVRTPSLSSSAVASTTLRLMPTNRCIAFWSMCAVMQSNGSGQVAQTILSALCNKIFHGKSTMTADTDYHSTRWQNLMQLNKLLKKYIFMTSFWRSTTAAEDEKERETFKSEEAKRREDLKRAGHDGTPAVADAVGIGMDDVIMTTDSHTAGPAAASSMGGVGGGSAAADRHRMAELMERKRREAEEHYILAKCRVIKSIHNFTSSDDTSTIAITDFGLHWNEKGDPADLLLVELVKKLFKALRIDEFDPQTASPNLTSQERAFLVKCKTEAEFWRDSAVLMGVLRRQHIDNARLYTYRKLSFVIADWMKTTTTSARESLIADMKYIITNGGMSRTI